MFKTVEELIIPAYVDKRRILMHIKSKAAGCGTSGHWILREPTSVNEKIYLRGKDIEKRRGEKVPVRRVLYYLHYKGLPLKRITMVCGNEKCINPAHMRIRGWEREANDRIEDQIERGWLDPEDAKEWFEWKNIHNVKLPTCLISGGKYIYEEGFEE